MLKVSPLFSDGAVLCRNKEIRIFGEAAEGQPVTVTLRGPGGEPLAEACCRGKDGRFLALLPPQAAGTGRSLLIRSGGETVEVSDVAVGDVFLAGGQSNMELELRNADEGPDIVRTYCDPMLRFLNVPRKAFLCEEAQKAWEETRWEAIAPGQGGSNSAVAYFFAARVRERDPEVPVGIIGCYWGGTSVSCWIGEADLRTCAEGARYLDEYAEKAAGKSMEDYLREEKSFTETLDVWNRNVEQYKAEHPGCEWRDIEAACGPAPWFPPAGPGSPYRPGGLAESMMDRVTPAALTGLLYYQGEDDADRTDRYDELMVLLIRSWRERFMDPALPFLFVQLPMWINYDAEESYRWPRTRLAQAAARDLVRNSGMVCLLDQGEYGNIHPTAKRPVGERLADLWERMTTGRGAVSPRALGKHTEGNVLVVTLDEAVLTPPGEEPALMEIAGEDGVFYPSKAEIRGRTLRLTAAEAERPVHARYAWCDWSDRVNLTGWNGLPLEPFRF